MRAAFGLVLILGVALAGLAVYMAQSYLGQSEARLNAALEQQQRTGKLVEVYAVLAPVKFGDPITQDNVQRLWTQANKLPTGVIQDAEILFPANATKPRLATRSLEANEILLSSRMTEPGEMASLTGKLTSGQRAYQVRVSVASGVADFVMPDDLIDIYWTGDSAGGEVTRLIEKGVRIIAVDQSSEQSERSDATAQNVTVVVTPEQVARLAQAQATGRMSMSLVGDANDDATTMVEVDRAQLLGLDQVAAPVETVVKVCTIKTRKGDQVIDTPIPCTN